MIGNGDLVKNLDKFVRFSISFAAQNEFDHPTGFAPN